MKKQASTLLPALLDLLRQYLALDMAVYAGHATLLLLTASLPLLMWVLVIINMLPFYSVSDIAALVAQLLPDIPAIQSMAVDVIANLNNQSTTFMASFAAITTVISASGGMAAVQKGLQKLTPGARKTMFDRLWAVLYTFLFEGLMLVAIVVQSLSPILRGLAGLLPLHTLVGGLLQRLHSLLSISAVLSLALSLLTVTLIYTYVPGGKRRIRDQLPGAAAVVAVWTLFSKIFSFYIGHFWKLSYIYGSLAAIVLITLWLNVNINVLFLGAALNARFRERGRRKRNRMLEIHPRARCPHRTGKKRKYWAANLQTMCRKRRSHRPAWRAVICAYVGMRASRLMWPGVQCALPRAPQGQTLFPNALNPYKHYLIHQQGGREVFPAALFYCSRFIAFFEP